MFLYFFCMYYDDKELKKDMLDKVKLFLFLCRIVNKMDFLKFEYCVSFILKVIFV